MTASWNVSAYNIAVAYTTPSAPAGLEFMTDFAQAPPALTVINATLPVRSAGTFSIQYGSHLNQSPTGPLLTATTFGTAASAANGTVTPWTLLSNFTANILADFGVTMVLADGPGPPWLSWTLTASSLPMTFTLNSGAVNTLTDYGNGKFDVLTQATSYIAGSLALKSLTFAQVMGLAGMTGPQLLSAISNAATGWLP